MLELGFSTFFLNRTNRSGIIAGGVIGGLKQNSRWKINVRYNKEELINRIRRISLYKNSIKIYNLDASELIKSVHDKSNKKIFVYFDPPYYNKGKDLYLNYYTVKDHENLFKQIKKLRNENWILTYDNVKQIKELYSCYNHRKYNLRYSAGKKNMGQELMIFSDKLYYPKYSEVIKYPVYS